MRFTAASIAFFAGLAAALPNGDVETVYETKDVTITSCAPTVTNCPAHSTSTPQGAGAVTASYPTSESAVPTPSAGSSSVPVIPAPYNTAPAAPSSSVIAVTTCVPTVTYITVPVATPSGHAGAHSSVPVIPSAPTGKPSPSATPSSIPPGGLATGAGNTVSGSFLFAGAAAAAAFFLA
ncbi:hypothetical protein Aspvir_006513 [Aspergillus viridinutans]|uniref:GPI anchored serine-rich protein n=1 Tax=Aspergillus viridinutans TaxID=75553 RepID=A0A9P3F243_ASPVI|nr:uncharacterized protein Aspvir_006513 [Aspergillus viridinutans]GIK02457.1 hypothetical protein Aspvir_006513 [Aspergillus viridinutans]